MRPKASKTESQTNKSMQVISQMKHGTNGVKDMETNTSEVKSRETVECSSCTTYLEVVKRVVEV